MNRDRASAHEGVQAGAESGFAPRPQTPHQLLGPYFPVGCAPIASGDLTVADGNGAAPRGEIIEVTGRVLNLDSEPICGVPVTIWQANTFGRSGMIGLSLTSSPCKKRSGKRS